MTRVVLLDHLGLPLSEADIPDKLTPQALVWGPDVFVAVDPEENGRPRYRMVRDTYVIPDTRESSKV